MLYVLCKGSELIWYYQCYNSVSSSDLTEIFSEKTPIGLDQMVTVCLHLVERNVDEIKQFFHLHGINDAILFSGIILRN